MRGEEQPARRHRTRHELAHRARIRGRAVPVRERSGARPRNRLRRREPRDGERASRGGEPRGVRQVRRARRRVLGGVVAQALREVLEQERRRAVGAEPRAREDRLGEAYFVCARRYVAWRGTREPRRTKARRRRRRARTARRKTGAEGSRKDPFVSVASSPLPSRMIALSSSLLLYRILPSAWNTDKPRSRRAASVAARRADAFFFFSEVVVPSTARRRGGRRAPCASCSRAWHPCPARAKGPPALRPRSARRRTSAGSRARSASPPRHEALWRPVRRRRRPPLRRRHGGERLDEPPPSTTPGSRRPSRRRQPPSPRRFSAR